MNKTMNWVLYNALIPTSMIAVAAILASIYQTGEITASQYRVLTDVWPRAGGQLRSHIKDAMVSGRISRWTYIVLFQETRYSVGGILITPGGDVEQERSKLQQRMNNG